MVTGNISKFGKLYTLNLMLISTRGVNTGVIKRASDKCKCSDEELVSFADRVALKLIGKEPRVAATTIVKTAPQRETGSQFQQGESFPNSIGQKFVYIEPGTFMMGSPSNEPERDDDET